MMKNINKITQITIFIGISFIIFIALFITDVLDKLLFFISTNYILLSLTTFLAFLAFFLILFSISNIKDIVRLLGIIKNNVNEIKKSKSDIYYLLNSMLGMVYITDINGKINWANRSLLAYDKEIIGKSVNEIFNYNNNETQYGLINKAVTNNLVEKSIIYYPPDTLFHSETYIEHRAIPITDTSEQSTIIVVSENITGQMQLSESKQRLSLMVSASKDAIFVVDLNLNITSWNTGAEELFGYLHNEIIGHPIMILDHLINFNTLSIIFDLNKIIKTRNINNIENVEVKGIDFFRIVDFTVYPFFDDIGSVIGISAIVRDRTETIKAKKALELSEMQMRKLALHLDAVREEERKEIAFVIHDELGYALSAIKMDISWLRRNVDKMLKGNIIERTNDMLKLIDMTIQNVKILSSNLRPPILDHFGLIAAIEEQSREFQRRSGVRCKVNVEPSEDINIPENIRTPIFRIFQEAQTNITRYAKASRVDINISYYNELFVLEIIDNGIGIPNEKINAISSFGLLGIKEKAKSIGGKIFISSKKNEGTTIRLELNIKL